MTAKVKHTEVESVIWIPFEGGLMKLDCVPAGGGRIVAFPKSGAIVRR
jgi:hypothetical protein